MGNALNAKLSLRALLLYWLVNRSRWIKDHYGKNIANPSQSRPAKTIKRGRLLEKIIGCHSEKAVNDKIVRTSCGIKITASEAFSLLMYFSVSFSLASLFLSFASLKFQITLQHGSSSFFLALSLLPRDPRMNSQNLFRELKSLCRPPSHCLPLCLASLHPHCSVFDCGCTSRQSTRYLIVGKRKLN